MCRIGLLSSVLVLSSCGILDLSDGIRFQSVDSTFVVTDSAIDPETHPPEEAPGEILVDSLYYRAEVVPEDTAVGAGPMSWWIEVTVRNPLPRAVELPVLGCTVWPHVYEDIQRSDEPVWVPQGTCAQAPYTVDIGAGETAELSFLAYEAMLASALPDGRYYVTAEFRRAEDTLWLRAGSGDVRFREPGLAFSVSLGELDQAVRAEVAVTNRNDVPVELEYGACSLGLTLHRDAGRMQPVARWLSSQEVCPAYLALATVAPGETHRAREFTREFPGRRLSDVDPGTYYLSVDLGLNWHTYHFPLGEVEVY